MVKTVHAELPRGAGALSLGGGHYSPSTHPHHHGEVPHLCYLESNVLSNKRLLELDLNNSQEITSISKEHFHGIMFSNSFEFSFNTDFNIQMGYMLLVLLFLQGRSIKDKISMVGDNYMCGKYIITYSRYPLLSLKF